MGNPGPCKLTEVGSRGARIAPLHVSEAHLGRSGGRNDLKNEQTQQILVAVKVTYDSELDVLRVLFSDARIEESDEDKPGVILDYDAAGNVVGLEILNASQRVDDPRVVDYAVTA